MLVALESNYKISWLPIEISGDDTLTEKYGLKIPVLRHMATQLEINWPFSASEIINLIQQ